MISTGVHLHFEWFYQSRDIWRKLYGVPDLSFMPCFYYYKRYSFCVCLTTFELTVPSLPAQSSWTFDKWYMSVLKYTREGDWEQKRVVYCRRVSFLQNCMKKKWGGCDTLKTELHSQPLKGVFANCLSVVKYYFY